MRLAYRVQQFRQGVLANVIAEEYQQVAAFLPTASYQLFQMMPMDIQRHSLNVLYTLVDSGHVPSLAALAITKLSPLSSNNRDRFYDLATAALLHDVGKAASLQTGIPLNSWTRAGVVLSEKVAPKLFAKIASDNPKKRIGYMYHVHAKHPAIGAKWAAEAGCSQLTCWLIAHHQDKNISVQTAPVERISLLQILQWADEQH